MDSWGDHGRLGVSHERQALNNIIRLKKACAQLSFSSFRTGTKILLNMAVVSSLLSFPATADKKLNIP